MKNNLSASCPPNSCFFDDDGAIITFGLSLFFQIAITKNSLSGASGINAYLGFSQWQRSRKKSKCNFAMKIKDGFTTSISRAEGRRGKLAPLLKDSGFMLGWVQGKNGYTMYL